MTTKKETTIKVEAVLDFKMDKNETGSIMLYGILLDCAKGKATAKADPALVESLIDAGKLKKVK